MRRDWCPLSKDVGNFALQQILESGKSKEDAGGRRGLLLLLLLLLVVVVVCGVVCSCFAGRCKILATRPPTASEHVNTLIAPCRTHQS